MIPRTATEFLPLVSIAIPTYNRADGYLREALACAVGQTYRNIEIIVSDNCSTDSTGEVVRHFGDHRVRYIKHEKNIGANNNFNFCLQEAKGSYFLLLHDDDLIEPDFVETCMKAVDPAAEVGLIRTGLRVVDSGRKLIYEAPNLVAGLSTEEFLRGWFAGKTPMHLCSTLFSTEKLRSIGGFGSRTNLFQDVIAEVQLAARFGRVDIKEIKAEFRKHGEEMTFAVKVADWCEDSLMLIDVMTRLVPEESKDAIRKEGTRFLVKLNYNRADAVKSPLGRLAAYRAVLRAFGYGHFPPKNRVYSLLVGFLEATPFYPGARLVKRTVKRIFSLG